MMKQSTIPSIFLLTLVLLLIVTAVVNVAGAEDVDASPAIVSLTTEELAAYNGKDGMPAYVAVSGKVYDVSDSAAWTEGIHQGQYNAGQDLTDFIAAAPHGTAVLEDLPLVAYLLTGEDAEIPETAITVSELATYNGKDGNAAYIAVDGIVYDVSDSAMWPDATHQNQYAAGADYSELIRLVSPHGISVLDNVPVVGRLVFDPAE